MTLRCLSVLTGAVLFATACGSSTTSPATTPADTFHSEVADPVGDAVVSGAVPSPPDLIRGTVDVAGGNLSVNIQFAPGTLNRQSTLLTIQLDTDQNPATGIVAATGVGIDYVLSMYPPTNQTIVQRATPATCINGGGMCYTDAGTVSLSVAADSMSATVPLSMLGNASGRLNYRVYASVTQPPPTPTVTTDAMPDNTLPPAHVP